MKQKKVKVKPQPKKKYTCGDCKLKWQDEKQINRDINGRPFAWRCPYSEYIRLSNWDACSNIKL